MSGSKRRIRPLSIHFLLDHHHHHHISPPLCCCRPAGQPFHVDVVCEVTITVSSDSRYCSVSGAASGIHPSSGEMRLDTTRGWLLPGSVYRAQSLILSVLVQQRRRIGPSLSLSFSRTRDSHSVLHLIHSMLIHDGTDGQFFFPRKNKCQRRRNNRPAGRGFYCAPTILFLFAPSSTSPAASVRQVRESK